ncbi:MAG: hypothetical protein QNI92_16700 [Desulfobacterales bacterium]|nr:hypothetical protein [Desulfobacterales bacterium]
MANQLMTGYWRFMLSIPPFLWKKQIAKVKRKIETELQFMSADHRRVHHFVVRELPCVGKALSPQYIADKLNLPVDQMESILGELEAKMTFLFRNPTGEVIWAYPVTVERTPHQVTFSTGERLFAA